ncbi:hypothetical protein ACT29H_02415 [Thermophagus sp. OGC60D27]|uniref:hypothetical protein n=1 Tax=Thermophagus sp. OGC60D27 TaxID=3458415 RepID=UPI0040383B94
MGGKRNIICTLTLVIVLSFCSVSLLRGQYVPVHVDDSGIYDFVDELANEGVIDVNTIAKPYSRKEIARWLEMALDKGSLTSRQRKEVAFYLRDYGKELHEGKVVNKRFDLFYYSDSLFRLTVNPILGMGAFMSGKDVGYYRYNGGEIYGSIGSHVGFYGSLRDNHESEIIGGESYLLQKRGAVYKGEGTARDFSEARGGISWSWNWGSFSLEKDHYIWGHGYNGTNIFSGNVPSYAFISLVVSPVSWLELRYLHGWLVSEVVDTVRSFSYYDGVREVFTDKYVAANMITVRPVPRLYVSAGNSIVYADTRVNPAFLIPVMFYKSVDHTYNGASNEVGQNAQMFFDVSSRQMDHFHLYSTLFVDEISLKRMFDKDQNSNYVSLKAGVRMSGIPSGFSFTAEYTRTNPMVYQHKIPTTTWESNGYNMGHYLRDNSDEWFLGIQYRPVRGMFWELSYTRARKGKDYQSILINGEEADHPEINQEEPRWGLPFMNEVKFEMEKVSLKGYWQVIHNGYLFVKLTFSDIGGLDKEKYVPLFYLEDDFSGQVGINFGF